MLTGKFIVTLLGLLMAIFAILNVGKSAVVENWWGTPGFEPRAQPSYYNQKTGQSGALGVSVLTENTMGSGKFFQVPNFQAILSPRFSNVDYGAHIRYNMPSRENLASPCNPLTFSNMASDSGSKENFTNKNNSSPQAPVQSPSCGSKENYCVSCGTGQCGGGCPPSCGKGGYGMGHDVAGGYELPSGYAAGNYWDEYNSLPSKESLGADLPVGTMTTMDGAGNQDQFVAFNRIMFANKTPSRRWAQGDMIRGDLAITPCNTGWFSVYPDISRDLNAGALNVMTGTGGGGEANSKLMELLVQSTGGTRTTFGGVDLSELNNRQINMNAQSSMQLQAAMSDVNATAFP